MRALRLISLLLLLALACGSASRAAKGVEEPSGPGSTPGARAPVATGVRGEIPPPVPEAYQALYSELEADLERFHETFKPDWDGTLGEVVVGAELAPANGNRGEDLLRPGARYGVQLYLDRLQELGVGGVTVQISYPLLASDTPGSDEYLHFYQWVAQEVHNRELVLMVETGPAFPDPEYSNVQVDFAGLSIEDYFRERKREVLLIANHVQPDYLSLVSEPETEAMLTGYPLSPETALAFVGDTLEDVDRSSGVLYGAGSGVWEDPAYLERFASETDLDFVDLHIYPLQSGVDYLRRALEAAAEAHAQGKKLLIGEAWLYKASAQELLARKPYQEVFTRDVYGFWEPLDIRFIEAVLKIAQDQGFAYVSFFWSKYFFAYLDYDSAREERSAKALVRLSNQAAVENLQAGAVSETGAALEHLLHASRIDDE